MPSIGPDRVNPEGELLDHVVDEANGVLLAVPPVDLQGPDPGGIIGGGEWITPRQLTVLSLELQERDVDLDVMTRYLLGIAVGGHRASTHSVRQSVQPMSAQNPIHACVGDLDAVVALEILDDANRPQVIGTA